MFLSIFHHQIICLFLHMNLFDRLLMVQIIYRFKYRSYLSACVLFNLFVTHTHTHTGACTLTHTHTVIGLLYADHGSARFPRQYWTLDSGQHISTRSQMHHFLISQLCTIIIGKITETVVNYKVICSKIRRLDLVVTLVCLFVCGNESFP